MLGNLHSDGTTVDSPLDSWVSYLQSFFFAGFWLEVFDECLMNV